MSTKEPRTATLACLLRRSPLLQYQSEIINTKYIRYRSRKCDSSNFFFNLQRKPTFISRRLPLFCPGSVFFSSKNVSVLFIGWAGSAWSTLEDPDSNNTRVQCQTLASSQFVLSLLLSHILEFGMSS